MTFASTVRKKDCSKDGHIKIRQSSRLNKKISQSKFRSNLIFFSRKFVNLSTGPINVLDSLYVMFLVVKHFTYFNFKAFCCLHILTLN